MRVPIVIINWNGFSDTIECIQSVLKTREIEFEVHLVDNGSEQQEGRKLLDLYENESLVHVYQLESNIGFAKANNFILKDVLKSDSKFVALLNNDTEVDSLWLKYMLDQAEQTNSQIVSAKFLNYYDRTRIDNLGHQMLNTGEIIPIAHGENEGFYQETFFNMGSCAGAAIYSCEMLKEIGTFDPFFSTGYEDAELGLRAILSSYRSVFAPKALVYHKGGQSIKKIFNEDYALMIQSSIWYTYFKLMPVGSILISMPFILLKTVALTLINLFSGRWSYLRIQWKALYQTLIRDRKILSSARKEFYDRHQPISSMQILFKQRFFLWYDIKRFYQIFIRGRKSALDQYGGE